MANITDAPNATMYSMNTVMKEAEMTNKLNSRNNKNNTAQIDARILLAYCSVILTNIDDSKMQG